MSAEEVYASGACEIDLVRRELRVLGTPAPIGARALEIIGILTQASGELVSKDELMSRVWPGAIVNDNALQIHISAFRKALGSFRSLLRTESVAADTAGSAVGSAQTSDFKDILLPARRRKYRRATSRQPPTCSYQPPTCR
jgi:hypothetical protein